MKIKLTKTITLKGFDKAQRAGTTIEDADDAEAKALIAMGYAKAVGADAKAKTDPGNDKLAKLLEGNVDEVTAGIAKLGADDLERLSALESAGKDRTGVHNAIDAALEATE